MPFESFVPAVKSTTVAKAPVRAGLQKRGSHAMLSLSVARSLADELGWNEGDKLAVELGTDDDSGKMRLKVDAQRGVLEVRHSQLKFFNGVRLNFGHLARLPNRAEQPADCCHTVDGDWLLIMLPDWPDKLPAIRTVHQGPPRDGLETVPATGDGSIPVPPKLTANLAARAARAFGVQCKEIFAEGRGKAQVALARQAVMYVLSGAGGYSATDIGPAMNRDRTSVMHGIAAIVEREDEPALSSILQSLSAYVKELKGRDHGG